MEYTYYIAVLFDGVEKEGRSCISLSAIGPFCNEQEMEKRLIEVANEFTLNPYPSVIAIDKDGVISTIEYPKSFFEENVNI